MKLHHFSRTFPVLALLCLSGCTETVVVHRPPPPPPVRTRTEVVVLRDAPPPPADRVEILPPRPPHAVWVKGHWHWNGHRYVWIGGHWRPA